MSKFHDAAQVLRREAQRYEALSLAALVELNIKGEELAQQHEAKRGDGSTRG